MPECLERRRAEHASGTFQPDIEIPEIGRQRDSDDR
jgi:hypothetical protein